MRRVLITGVTGYIGSHLARSLLEDSLVFGLARRPVNLEYISDMEGRLRLLPFDGGYDSVEAAVREARPEIVYHLAAYYTGGHGALESPRLLEANITLGAYLLEAMAACRVPALVYASSVMAHYGGAAYRPLNLYAATKQAFADLLAYYTDAGLLRAAGLVLSDTYGPGDRRPKVLNLVKAAAKSGGVLELSDGGQDYDALFIGDVVRAFRTAGESLPAGGPFQVAPEKPLTLRETAERMLRINGASARLYWGRRPAAEREIRRAVRVFPALPGWRPEVSLDEGLRRMWEP